MKRCAIRTMAFEHRISKCNGDVLYRVLIPANNLYHPSTIVYDLDYIIVVIQEPKNVQRVLILNLIPR